MSIFFSKISFNIFLINTSCYGQLACLLTEYSQYVKIKISGLNGDCDHTLLTVRLIVNF